MAELKRVFSTAIMNKDMDERLVPNGQYRDATNVEIATSEGSEVGTVQTLFGNTERNLVLQGANTLNNIIDWTTSTATIGGSAYNMMGPHTLASVVGTVANVNTDKIYYLVSGGDFSNASVLTNYFGATASYGVTNNVAKDYILEYDTINDVHRYVFVDIFKVYTDVKADNSLADTALGSTTFHVSAQDTESGVPPGIRRGMQITAFDLSLDVGSQQVVSPSDGLEVVSVTFNTNPGNDGSEMNRWQVTTNKPHQLSDNFVVVFDAPDRVLKFNKERLITGINILDDFLFWTDNDTEPKKIHIKRSIAGTGGAVELNDDQIFYGDNDYFHTRLVKDKVNVSDPTDANSRYRVATNSTETYPIYATEEHVTVIRKGPTQPLDLEMYRTHHKRVTNEGVENPTTGVVPPSGDLTTTISSGQGTNFGTLIESGQTTLPFFFSEPVDFREGDFVLISNEDITNDPNTFAEYLIRAEVILSPNTNANQINNGPFALEILSIDPSTPVPTFDETPGGEPFDFTEPAYGPWFFKLEDKRPMFENRFPRFSYRYKYQDGEYSTFAPWSQIAFLPDYYEYYPKKGYNLGMVNQLRSLRLRYYHHDEDIIPQDVVEIDILYKEAGRANVYTVKTLKPETQGELSDMIWPDLLTDSTRRGSFDITTDLIHAVVPENQLLRPWDNVPRKALAQEISANRLIYGNYLQNFHIAEQPIIKVGYDETLLSDSYYFPDQGYAYPSVKTMRKYQVGVVFSDGYGRETPVLTHEGATTTVLKDASDRRNRISCQLDPKFFTHPDWAEYMSWYIKESTVEYYTMAMDRWYNAADGNIWLSFPSSDRNKLDDETFIVLKKAHGEDTAVKEKARYRILAIENDAPDFIKTVKKSLGRLPNGTAATGVLGQGSANGFPFQDTNFIIFENSESEFSDVFGDLEMTTPDTLMIKFHSEDDVSEEYEVARVIRQGGGSSYRLNLVEKIGEDAAFLSIGDTFEGASDNIVVELIEHEVENKPEFDGKFFVKIYKDTVLDQYVLASQLVDYVVSDAWDLGYLNNNGFTSLNPDTGMFSANFAYQIANGGETFYNNRSAAFNGGLGVNITAGATTVYDYANATRNVAGTSYHPTEYWHHIVPIADGGLGQTAYQWLAQGLGDAIDNNPYLAINDGWDGPARNFWQKHVTPQRIFFIDACTAYTYVTGEEDAGDDWYYPGVLNSYGGSASDGFFHDDDNNPTQAFFNWPGAGTGYPGPLPATIQGNESYYPPNTDWASAFINHQGQPSRGIWEVDGPLTDEVSFMDISWSGMGSNASAPGMFGGSVTGGDSGDLSGIAEGPGGIYHQLQNLNFVASEFSPGATEESAAETQGIFTAASLFIDKLTTIGTKFRFNRDPDKTVYTVVDVNFPTFFQESLSDNGGYQDDNTFHPGTTKQTGAWGIRNYRPDSDVNNNNEAERVFESHNLRQRWTIAVSPRIGSNNAGYSPTKGTGGYRLENGEIVADTMYDVDTHGELTPDNIAAYRRALRHDLTGDRDLIQILDPYFDASDDGTFTDKPGIWETEPKESVDLDIYYQASGLTPLSLSNATNEEYLPISQSGYGGTKFRKTNADGDIVEFTVTGFNDKTITFEPALTADTLFQNGEQIIFTKRDSYSITGYVDMALVPIGIGDTTLTLHDGQNTDNAVYHIANQKHWLDWNNCWCFGNGVESDRIRDDFNAAQVDNGVKASTVLAEQVTEERRKHGLIWSGIYNSNSGINNLNQFIQAEKITKDLNPVYGSIQNLLNRDTRLVMFCEDKILRGVTNKDALYNADGNPQLVASNAVIGDVTPYLGDYGISTNPESLAVTPSNVYFSDVVRGKVIALGNQGDGMRVISDIGMKDYFGDLFADDIWRSIGTYDIRKKEYNLSVYKKYTKNFPNPYSQTTISFSEQSSGWVSFKSFYPQLGISLNNSYYTFNNGSLWEHHINATRNNFYGTQSTSDITLLFNDQPNTIKSFMALNYEGSKAKIPNFDTEAASNWLTGNYSTNSGLATQSVTDGEYFNLAPDVLGWYASEVTTNLQECINTYFIDKESKYYGYPAGATTTHGSHCDMTSSNLDESESSVQGIGLASITHGDSTQGDIVCLTIANNITASYEGDDETGGAWDTAADLAEDAARWTCTSQTIEVEGGATIGYNVPGSLCTLTISPFDSNGDPTGALLSAANFTIGPESAFGTTQSGLTYSNVSNALNVDPDNDDDISTITFADTGTAGTADNTVTVAIQFNTNETWPTADDTWYLDIDETRASMPDVGEPEPDNVGSRKVCFHVTYDRINSPITEFPVTYDVTAIAADADNENTIYNEGVHMVESDISVPVLWDNPTDDPDAGAILNYSGDSTTYEGTWGENNPWGTGDLVTYTYTQNIKDRMMHDGWVPNGQTSLVAKYEFECKPIYNADNEIVSHYFFATQYNVQGAIDCVWTGIDETYSPYYDAQVYYGDMDDPEYWYNMSEAPIEQNIYGFVLKKFEVRIYYTPPPGLEFIEGQFGALPGGMCSINPGPHTCNIRYNALGYVSWVVDGGNNLTDISDVSYTSDVGNESRSVGMRVIGTPGTTFNLRVTKSTSEADYSPDVSGNGWWDPDTNSWASTVQEPMECTIGPGGNVLKEVIVPSTTSKKYYDIIVEPLLDASGTRAALTGYNVPTSYGMARVTQHGVRTATITPITSTAGNFGTLPTLVVKRPARYEGSSLPVNNSMDITNIKGGNNSKSSTKITINKFDLTRLIGYTVLTPFIDSGIPHGTTVVSVDENQLTLSNSVSLANNTNLTFTRIRGGMTEFSFTINPGAGKRFILNSDIDYHAAVFTKSGIRKTVNGAQTDDKTIEINEITNGIEVGMAVVGPGLVNSPEYDYLRVETVNAASRLFTVGSNQNISDGTQLSFTWPESLSTSTSYSRFDGNNSAVSLYHAQASISGHQLLVQGYMDIPWLGKDNSTIDINLDDFVTVI